MKRKTKTSNFLVFATFISVVSFCQLFNYLAIRYLQFEINSKLFFGLFGNNLVSVLISLLALYFLFTIFVGKRKFYLSLAITTAAAFSNQIDRLIYSGVVDYIKIFSFPSFNIADIFIVAGLIYLVSSSLRSSR